MPEQIEGDRIVVRGSSDACFFPRTERETSFIREFDGRSDAGPFLMGGSIYGRDLKFRGSGRCRGIVVGRGSLQIDAANPGESQMFCSPISATGSVSVQSPALSLRESLCGDVRRASVMIRGDVVGSSVDLWNTVVLGNVHGTDVRLTNSIVYGSVVASESAMVRASTLMYYHAARVTFEGPCMMLHAMGESSERPVFAPFEDVTGEIFPADVRYYPALRANGSLSNRCWEGDLLPMSRLIPGADWVTVNTELEASAHSGVRALARRTILTIAGRVLNIAALRVSTDQMAALMKLAFEFDHYNPRARRDALAELRNLANHEEALVFLPLLSAVSAGREPRQGS
jgi:hypothetical protein